MPWVRVVNEWVMARTGQLGLVLARLFMGAQVLAERPAALGLGSALCLLFNLAPLSLLPLLALERAYRARGPLVMAEWGGSYLLVSGAWALTGLSWPLVAPTAFALVGLISAGFYGVVATALHLALRGRARFLVLPLAIPLAEVLARQIGISLSPLGLILTDGTLGSIIALGGLPLASFALAALAVWLVTWNTPLAPPLGVLALLLFTLLPGPAVPVYDGPPILAVSHNPDPTGKWTPEGSKAELAKLIEHSKDLAGKGIIVWPELAYSASFDIEAARAALQDVGQPLIFGMNRYATPGLPTLRNSAVLLEGDDVQVSEKKILVPISERAVFGISAPDVEPGERRILTLADGTAILPIICYEAHFPIPTEDLDQAPDAILILSAETILTRYFTGAMMERYRRARELETGIRVFRISDRPE